MEIDKLIERFILKHHVITIATISDNGTPRTANLFYAYDKNSAEFIFTTSVTTNHGMDMQKNIYVGANVVLESSNIGRLEGLQIEGRAFLAVDEELNKAKKRYIKRFPFAVIADLEIWVLKADFFKFTDNKLGFGKKILWYREEKY